MTLRILVIDDEQDTCDVLKLALEQGGASVLACTSARVALEHFANEEFDVVLTDLGMSEMGGIEFCKRIAATRSDVPVIVVTGRASVEGVIAAMHAGAYDFLMKPIDDPKIVTLAVDRAVEHYRSTRGMRLGHRDVASAPGPSGITGSSAVMQRLHQTIERVAAGSATVLVHGETGTGKELIARRIHEAGSRSNGPFVAINCAAVLPSLLESELFGHARGAFTDAKHERKGLFVQADQGTLFLDEVAEMPLDMQAKLLRALQERRVRPVGANVEVAFDVRLVTATNRDLEALVRQRLFREDLFYRIDVARIRVPPLRERSADVLELAHYFLGRYAARVGRPPLGISSEAAKRLSAYTWPGNVRELENCIERALAFARGDEIGVDDLPENVEVRARENEEIVTLAEVEKQYVSHALGVLGNNKTLAAELLGVDRRTLSRKIARWKNGQRASSPSQPSGEVNVPDAESE